MQVEADRLKKLKPSLKLSAARVRVRVRREALLVEESARPFPSAAAEATEAEATAAGKLVRRRDEAL